jgi:NAD(P)-dependent dehydrogenase (short-subunit alcohol dehydrogenase family)
MEMAQFEGKVAIVTGGGSGIGEAIVRELAAGGARVVVADHDQAGIDRVVASVTASGGVASGFAIDVASAEQNAAMVAFAEKTYGGLHLAVNNAGVGGPSAPTGEYPLDGWKAVMDVNLNGVFYGLRYEIAAMLKSGGGAVVNMASILGSVGFAGAVAYTSAKHALLGMTKVAAMEYAPKGVRINAVGPGFIDTPLLAKNLDATTLKYIAGLHPMQRLGRPEEVSALACFLLSDRASFITGSYHLVDGGYVAQ